MRIITVRQLATLIETLPDYSRIVDRVAQLDEDAEFAQASIDKLLSNAAVGTLDTDFLRRTLRQR